MTETKLNLTFDNVRRGDFSDKHAMIDVYLDGKFISTYQWNPFYKLEAKEIAKRLGNRGGYTWANREIEGVMGTHYPSALNNITVWQGKKWGRRLSENYDKQLTDIMFKYCKIDLPDAYDVEYALVRDAECFESARDFEDFCWEFGYDTDSRKAERAYNDCKNIFCDLIKTVGTTGFQELKETHQDD